MLLKQTILLFNVIGLLIYKLFFVEAVSVSINAPANSSAGKEITVEINVSKGTTAGFAKFQQEIPPGCNATVVDAAGGNFSFADGTVKIIWMSLPPSASYKIVYKLAIDATASIGQIPLAGKFSYLENNEKKTLIVPTATVMLAGGSTANAAPQPTTTETPVASTPTETAATTPAAPATETPIANTQTTPSSASAGARQVGTQGNVTVTRDVPPNATGEFMVTLTIKKPGITGFAKMEEVLADGLTATNIESASGVFSFVDNKVKFLWMSLPPAEEFKISYKVTVKPTFAGNMASISGTLSFLENDETRKAAVPASEIALGGSAGGTQMASTVTPTKTTQVVDNTQTPVKEKPVKAPKVNNDNSGGGASSGNVVYKVQICATHKSVPNTYFKDNWSVADAVISEQHEGWYKYTAGKYSQYSQARDKRTELTANAQIPGPFVSAYNGGNRITVQEGLMISRQSWVQ